MRAVDTTVVQIASGKVSMSDVIIGIDPGLTGALAFMQPNGLLEEVVDMPVMAKGKGKTRVKNQINAPALSAILQERLLSPPKMRAATVYLERVSAMSGQGVASVFSLGDTYGCIRGVVGSLGIPIHIITPQMWKKFYTLPSDKEVCRAKAIELYPAAPLERKKDHNRAEAILIARYGCRSDISG